jgi:hypothetical protein
MSDILPLEGGLTRKAINAFEKAFVTENMRVHRSAKIPSREPCCLHLEKISCQ